MVGFSSYEKRMMGQLGMRLYNKRSPVDMNNCMNKGNFLECLRPYE